MNYARIKAAAEGNAAHFKHLENYRHRFKLREGMPLADEFPSDAAYRMNDDYPDALELHAFLHNLDSQLVVNEAARDFLDAHGVQDVEYLPVRVINHKGRTVPTAYFVVNLLRHVDCIDQEQTQFVWDSLDDELMDQVANLTIDEARIDPEARLFRLQHLTSVIVIRRDLAAQLREAGFRGFALSELADYKG